MDFLLYAASFDASVATRSKMSKGLISVVDEAKVSCWLTIDE